MMFMIRQGERRIVVGPPQPRHCPRCDEESAFVPELKYSYGEFDLVFGFIYDKHYRLLCPTCEHGWLLDSRAVERDLDEIPIPIRLRFGPAIFAGLAALLWKAVAAYRPAG